MPPTTESPFSFPQKKKYYLIMCTLKNDSVNESISEFRLAIYILII